MMTLTLPDWMVEWIVAILSDHPYTGAEEIVEAIKEQTREPIDRHFQSKPNDWEDSW